MNAPTKKIFLTAVLALSATFTYADDGVGDSYIPCLHRAGEGYFVCINKNLPDQVPYKYVDDAGITRIKYVASHNMGICRDGVCQYTDGEYLQDAGAANWNFYWKIPNGYRLYLSVKHDAVFAYDPSRVTPEDVDRLYVAGTAP